MRALYAAFLMMTVSGLARVPDGLADALAARSLLGPDDWARVVRIENTGERGFATRKGYPSVTYALIFELSGILWFYCDADGTQSLSVTLGSVEADKLNPGPLLKAISPRFGAWKWVDASAPPDPGRRVPPPNDCFIECVAILRQRIAAGAELRSPRLLFFYVDTPTGRLGHTVLVFQARNELMAVDPDQPHAPIRIPAHAGADARSIACFVRGGKVARARELSLDALGMYRPSANWSALPPAGPPSG